MSSSATNEHLLMKEKDGFHNTSSESDRDLESEDAANGRHGWSKKTEYILSVVGYCVGLGNIWRFPYVCMRNGGGAFLIPFFLSLLVCAFPVYFLEVSLGQFISNSTWHAWKICPLFSGIGISMNILCFLFSWYYSIILAWCLIYMVNSFKSPLPWTQCGQAWNTDNCLTPDGLRSSSNITDILNSTTTPTVTAAQLSAWPHGSPNLTDFVGNDSAIFQASLEEANRTVVYSTEEFWMHNVLELSPGADQLNGIPWHTAIALIVSNLVVFAALIKGILSSGKVVYVTATLPYILLAIILIMGCTLTGSGDGLLFYITPDFKKLLVFQTWVEAAIQVFYSLGPGWGGLGTMASYNKFHNNCLKDSIMLTLICEGTSIFGGFAIFSVLGHMAHVLQVPITNFAKSGAGLAFLVYPEAISYLPVPQLWGFLFFLMLFTLGLDSQFAGIETIITTLADVWPSFLRRFRVLTTAVVMAVMTLASLVFTTRGGAFIFQLVDWYIAAFTLFIQTALQCVVIAWIYGADRFCYDIEMMIGRRPPYVIVLAWKFITPISLMGLFLITLITYPAPSFAGYVYPFHFQLIGWCMSVTPFLSIIVYALLKLKRTRGSLLQRVKTACQPSAEWGPSDPEAREKYKYQAPKLPVYVGDRSLQAEDV